MNIEGYKRKYNVSFLPPYDFGNYVSYPVMEPIDNRYKLVITGRKSNVIIAILNKDYDSIENKAFSLYTMDGKRILNCSCKDVDISFVLEELCINALDRHYFCWKDIRT